jgi:hypothetical protein
MLPPTSYDYLKDPDPEINASFYYLKAQRQDTDYKTPIHTIERKRIRAERKAALAESKAPVENKSTLPFVVPRYYTY